MEHILILIVVLVVFVACVIALIRWSGVPIPPIFITIAWYIIGGIILVTIIKLLWPMLATGIS